MPEFHPEHTPTDADAMTQGYLSCAEWLLDENVDRANIRGWSLAAQRQAAADCKDFAEANATDLDAYCAISGRTMNSAGHDFWLSRNGHGAGFFDRGCDPVFDRLQNAAQICGTCDVWVTAIKLLAFE